MRDYIIRRAFLMIPTLIISTMVVFLICRAVPGSVVDSLILQSDTSSNRDYDALRVKIVHYLGLDEPIHKQYVIWLNQVFIKGDLGTGIFSGTPLTQELAKRIPVTFEIGLLSFLLTYLIAIPVGFYSALRQESIGDYLSRSIAIAGICVPEFWVATLVIVLPAFWWGYTLPIVYTPFSVNPMENLRHIFPAVIIMGFTGAGGVMRLMRTSALDVLRQDYVRTAWSKGLKERTVVVRHVAKNALNPIVTGMIGGIPGIISGSMIMEVIFNFPGMGRFAFQAVMSRDFATLQGLLLVTGTIGLIFSLLIDLSYVFLDPRISYR